MRSRETLDHFRCGACGKWWTIGDAPPRRARWFRPWCGKAERHRAAKAPRH
jgi:hypothetical protein